MRVPIDKTYLVNQDMYTPLFNCCKNYFDNLAWKFPDECPDGYGCCGPDLEKLNIDLKYEIPSLYRTTGGKMDVPSECELANPESLYSYALLDLIEYIANNCKDISKSEWHSYYRHNDIRFADTQMIAFKFREEINEIFQKTGLLYTLTMNHNIERVEKYTPLTVEIEKNIRVIQEKGTQDLLIDAIKLYKAPSPQARQDSVEKIWDALERLKTYYSDNKNESSSRIVSGACGQKAGLQIGVGRNVYRKTD